MDLKGQKVCESVCFHLIVAATIVAFAGGLYLQSIRQVFCIYAGGIALTALVGVPNWPFFNRHPLKWLESKKGKD